MDAHLSSLSFGPLVVEAVRRVLPDATLDVHLMMSDPEAYLDDFRQAGSVSFTSTSRLLGHAASPGPLRTFVPRVRRLAWPLSRCRSVDVA